MQVVYRRCCGLDVHKSSITACVLVLGDKGQRRVRIKEFGTYLKELERLRLWLFACKVEAVAMESTGCIGSRCGTCWKGIFLCCWRIRIT